MPFRRLLMLIGRAARLSFAVLGALLLSAPAAGQEAYPSKPIALIVPFPPGGVADIVGRPVADAMSRSLGAPVVVENKPGAGGGIGMGFVAKAKPDGYTLLLALSSISILPEADKVTGRAPMYQLNQFVPIARLPPIRRCSPYAPTVRGRRCRSSSPTRAHRPGAISYGSSGNYGTMHMPMEMFAASAGVKLLHVPYTGAGPAVVALLGGNIDAVASGPSTVIQHVKAGKLRVLASWGESASASLPDVPTLTSRDRRRLLPVGRAVRAGGDARARARPVARGGARRGDGSALRRGNGDRRNADPVPRRARSLRVSGKPTRRSSVRRCAASGSSSEFA